MVYTFHEMAGILSGSTIENDASLLQFIRHIHNINRLPCGKLVPFDIVVLDEFQDCTELLYWLTCCFIRVISQMKAGGHPPRIVVLGDERQSIFRFRGADSRFLTRAPELLNPIAPYPWDNIQLDRSFRLSEQTVRFINEAFLHGQPYITSDKDGPKPIVLQYNPRKYSMLAEKLFPMINFYGAANSVILAPSIRKNWPLIDLTNILAQKYHVPIVVQTIDDGALDDLVTRGKMCVSTIHHFKGSERDLTIVLGMDSSFLKIFGRNLRHDQCPNEVFVALTRASKQLVLVQDNAQDQMPFVSVEALYETANVEILAAEKRELRETVKNTAHKAVWDIVRHMRDDVLYDIAACHLRIQELPESTTEIKLPRIVPSNRRKKYYEAVSDLNGLVAVATSELELAGTLKTLGQNNNPISDMPPINTQEYVKELYQRACVHNARVSGYRPRSIQLKNNTFEDIKPGDLEIVRKRVTKQLTQLRDRGTALKFEFEAPEKVITIDGETTVLNGKVDVVGVSSDLDQNGGEDVQFLVKIKFVSKLSFQHAMQAATYAYMLTGESGKVPRTILFNVRDGTKWVITPRKGGESLRCMIEDILRKRGISEKNDSQFMGMCEKARREVLGLGP